MDTEFHSETTTVVAPHAVLLQLVRLLTEIFQNLNVNLKISFCSVKHRRINTYGVVDVWLHASLTMALDED
jgi:hypothetical protein